ncbi:hypothetical protein SUDANB95_06162 [Actinosynnema sp. ALI-1.44]
MRKAALVGIAFLATLMTACGTGQPTAAPSNPDQPSVVASPSSSTPSSPPAVASSTASETPTPQPAPPPPPVTVEGTPCDITEGACIRLSTNESWLISGGKVEYGPVPITSGRPGYETPVGYFPVLHKVKDEVSRPYNNAPMPYSTYFTDYGIAFHQGSLTEESHGCIHLSMEAAIKYFNSLHSGEQVQVVA